LYLALQRCQKKTAVILSDHRRLQIFLKEPKSTQNNGILQIFKELFFVGREYDFDFGKIAAFETCFLVFCYSENILQKVSHNPLEIHEVLSQLEIRQFLGYLVTL